jgi:hypothetical protein
MEKQFPPNKINVLKSYYYPETGSRYEVFNTMYESEENKESSDSIQSDSIPNKKTDKPSKKYKGLPK